MAEYFLNQKCLERNCIAPSQSQASLQFTGILVHPWAKGNTTKNGLQHINYLSTVDMGNLLRSACGRY
ncbi:hypothetical protein I79_007037 [Cricetulus griseus]|uniref:Uncharacterized protein n=1 Tax=Cricetulus griseus TaxID=10029 RepID=G3H9G5_CRIGR|nr:hypothetical protein I79_007037 [Cricetulus griseus]